MGNAWPLSHETMPVLARIAAQVITAAAETFGDIIDMKYWQEVLQIVNVGDYAAANDGTLTVITEVGNAANMSDAVTLPNKGLTVASFSGSAQDDAVGIIRVRNEEMVVSGTAYRYLRLSVTPANQNLALGMITLGLGGRYQPGVDYDLAAVTEIIG